MKLFNKHARQESVEVPPRDVCGLKKHWAELMQSANSDSFNLAKMAVHFNSMLQVEFVLVRVLKCVAPQRPSSITPSQGMTNNRVSQTCPEEKEDEK